MLCVLHEPQKPETWEDLLLLLIKLASNVVLGLMKKITNSSLSLQNMAMAAGDPSPFSPV